MTNRNTNRSPADILMYGHKASGGSTYSEPMGFVNNKPHFKGGGDASRPKSFIRNGRHCHAEGDSVGEMGVNPVNGYKYPGSPENKNMGGACHGGRARHAEGDSVEAIPYKKGGTSHKKSSHHAHKKRRHHADGDDVDDSSIENQTKADGGMLSEYKKKGGMTRHRQHHSFGDFVRGLGNVVSTILPFAPLLLKDGGLANKHGGPAKKRRKHHADGDEIYPNTKRERELA